MADTQFMGYRGGFVVCNGDENLLFNYTAASGSPMRIQRNAATVFELDNTGRVSINETDAAVESLYVYASPSAAGTPRPVIKIDDDGYTGGAAILNTLVNVDNEQFQFVLDVYPVTDGKPAFVLSSKIGLDAPTGDLFSFGHTNLVGTYQEKLRCAASGLLELAGNMVWKSTVAGNIGSDTTLNLCPTNIYAQTEINSNGTKLLENEIQLGPRTLAAGIRYITALQASAPHPQIRYNNGTSAWELRQTGGGTFTTIALTSDLTWDAIYDADANGLSVDVSGRAFAIAQTTTNSSTLTLDRNTAASAANPVLKVTVSHASDANYGVYVQAVGATSHGVGVNFFDQADNVVQYIMSKNGTPRWSLYGGGYMTLSNAVTGSDALYIAHQSGSAAHGLNIANGDVQIDAGSTYTTNKYALLAMRQMGSALGDAQYMYGIVSAINGSGADTANSHIFGFAARDLSLSTGQTYGYAVNYAGSVNYFRYGFLAGGQLPTGGSTWGATDKSAMLIDSTVYSTTDSYGIVCTNTQSNTNKPSTLLAGGKAALLVSNDWDYGTYSLSKGLIQQTNSGGFGALTNSYAVRANAISSGTGLVTGDVFRCYDASFTPLNAVSGTPFYVGYYSTGSATVVTGAGKIGFYATADHDLGVWSDAPSSFSRISTATDNNTVLATFADSPVALNGGQKRSTYSSDLRGNAADVATSLTSSYRANVAGGETTGGAFVGFYSEDNLTFGVYSLAPSVFSRVSTTTDNNTVYATFAAAPVALSGGVERATYSSDLRGNAADVGTSFTSSFRANVAGGETTGGRFIGFHAKDTLTYGLYSEAKSYAAVTNSGGFAGSLTNSFVVQSKAISSGTGLVTGDVFRCYDATFTPLNAVSGTPFYVGYYSAGSATSITGAGKIGFYATADHDFGVWSVAPSAFSRVSTATDNNTVLATFEDSPVALNAGQERATYSSDLRGSGSDMGTSMTSSYRANVAGGETTTGRFVGFHAKDSLTYGLYSEAKNYATVVNNGGFGGAGDPLVDVSGYVVQSVAASVTAGLDDDDVFACYDAKFTPLAPTGTAYYIGYHATGAPAGLGAGRVGFYASANHDFGLWSKSIAVVDTVHTGSSNIAAVSAQMVSSASTTGTPFIMGFFADVRSASTGLAGGALIGCYSLVTPDADDGGDTGYIGYVADIGSANSDNTRIGLQIGTQFGADALKSYSIDSSGGRARFKQTLGAGWTNPYTYDHILSQLTSSGITNTATFVAGVRSKVIPSSSDTNGSYAGFAASCDGASTGISTYYGLYVSDAADATASMTKTGIRVYKWPASGMAIHVSGETTGQGGKVGLYQNWGTLTADATHVDITDTGTINTVSADLSCVKIAGNGAITAVGGNATMRCLDIVHTKDSTDTSNGLRYGIYEDVVTAGGGSAITYAQYITSNWNYGIVSAGDQNLFARDNGVLASSTYPVLKVQNTNTTTTTAHALHAKIAQVLDGQYAVALENSAQSSTTEGTSNHIGFTSAKSNTRNFPITLAVPNGADYTYTISVASTSHWICPNTTDNGKLLEMPLLVPHGSTLTAVRVVAKPGAANATLTQRSLIRLFKNSFGSGVYTEIGSVTYDDGTDTKQTLAISGLTEVINNTDVRYVIRYRNVSTNASTAAYVDSYRAEYTIQDLGAAPGY